MDPTMRIGIDLGGTKTELIVLDAGGTEIFRRRVPTDRRTYESILRQLASLVEEAEAVIGATCRVGVGIPGTISPRTGIVKNANTTLLNGRNLKQDLGRLLAREIRCMNDANCLALSEAVDGAGAGYRVVFAAILGTGCGAGLAVDGRPWLGQNLVAGEWGHNPLPWMRAEEFPGPFCWCGKKGCIERWISGTGFEDDYQRGAATERVSAAEIVARARQGEVQARQALSSYMDRLARALAHVINVLDPDIIVLGGGMSNVSELYQQIPPRLTDWVFGGEADTPLVPSRHGDSSGVRGAAWLWP